MQQPEPAEILKSPRDPLRFCVFTTLGLIAWIVTPAALVAFMGGAGLRAYYLARKAGLKESACLLRDTRLVMAYLGAAFFAGAFFTVRSLLNFYT